MSVCIVYMCGVCVLCVYVHMCVCACIMYVYLSKVHTLHICKFCGGYLPMGIGEMLSTGQR